MINHLRFRLTVVCTVVTAIILSVMAFSSLMVVQEHIANQEQATFISNVNTVIYYIQSQSTNSMVLIDHQWFSKTEQNNGLIISLEENGRPLLFRGAIEHDSRQQLAMEVKIEGEEKYSFSFSEAPSSTLSADTIYFTVSSNSTGAELEYWASLSTVPVSEDSWLGLSVLKSMETSKRQVQSLAIIFGLLTAAAIVGLGVFSWFFTGWAVRPIIESQRKQNEFISAASHELRSPLAVIQSSISAVLSSDGETAARFASNITEECVRMSRLVEDMLALASADSHTWTIQKAETDLETLLLTASENFEPMARKKGITLSVSLPEKVLPKCWCDKQRIAQVLSVLVDNAISYTPEGGRISLSTREACGGVELTVSDNGPGISDEMKKRIFERFYRKDTARTEKSHYGLGLSVAKEIVALHKGRLTVTDTPGGGATFHIFLNIK